MAQGSTRFEHLEKLIDADCIIEQQNKNTRAKTTRDVKLLILFLREKHDQRNPEDTVQTRRIERISLRIYPKCEAKRRQRLRTFKS